MKCNKCGSDRWAVVDRLGSIETWRCIQCGAEETVHINIPLSREAPPPNEEPVFRLVIEWSAKPGQKEVELLRSLFPRVKDLTLATMMRAARENRQIELGRFTESELRPMATALDSLNIKLSRIPIVAA